jgi:hypothetical protein
MSLRYQKSRPKTKPKYQVSSQNPRYYRSQHQSKPHRNPIPLPIPLPSRYDRSRNTRPSHPSRPSRPSHPSHPSRPSHPSHPSRPSHSSSRYIEDNKGLGQISSSHHNQPSLRRLSRLNYNIIQPSSRNVQTSSSSKYTSSSNHKPSYRSYQKSSHSSKSSSRGPSVYSIQTSTHENSSNYPPLPSNQCSEKPHVQVQHEVNHSTPPNLNLSTYGYSVNARETTRQKALHDAINKEGVDAVRSRMMFLTDKYVSQPPIVKVLIEDYDWMERYNITNEIRQRFEYQQEKTRKKIYQRMQEKSKSRRHSSQRD